MTGISLYLHQADYGLFGAPPETDPAKVFTASTRIDTYLERPEGLMNDGEVMLTSGEPIVQRAWVSVSGRIALDRTPAVKILKIESDDGIRTWEWVEGDTGRLYGKSTELFVGPLVWRERWVYVSYLAGWDSYDNLPSPIKLAASKIIQLELLSGGAADISGSGIVNSELPPGIKRKKAGDHEIEAFGPTSTTLSSASQGFSAASMLQFPNVIVDLLRPWRRVF